MARRFDVPGLVALGLSPSDFNHDNEGGGTPGGSDTQVQFNDAGSFGGSSGLTFVKDEHTIILKALTADDGFDVLKILDSTGVQAITAYADESPSRTFKVFGNPATGVQITLFASDTAAQVFVQNATTGNSVTVDGFNSLLKLTPIADPPDPAEEGMIYADTDHHLYYHNGTTWKQLDN